MTNRKSSEYVPDINKEVRLRRGVDKPMLAVIILLLCIGIVMVATASYVYAGSSLSETSPCLCCRRSHNHESCVVYPL